LSEEKAASEGQAPRFDERFRADLIDLIRWRRDVRRFRPGEAVNPTLLEHLIEIACHAPSVGYSQPWRFLAVESPERRAAVRENYQCANAAALAGYDGERAALYAGLKLSGLDDAPVQLAVFCDEGTGTGHGLGRRTMPEMLRYSVVTAVHTLWLVARSHGLGVGWVSILDPAALVRALEVPASWSLVAYLCIGWPVEEADRPELERRGWEAADRDCRTLRRC
jgi:5,6-dimethylbenzimidazole synthase